MAVRIADPSQAEALTALINLAFAVEKFFIEGDRTDPVQVRQYFEKGWFLAVEVEDRLAGCVYVEPRGSHAYMGMLSVHPSRHGNGLGRLLVHAAEDHARANGCEAMDLNIVNLREELPPFYRKLGYSETGTAPFEGSNSEKLKLPCHFILMTKPLQP